MSSYASNIKAHVQVSVVALVIIICLMMLPEHGTASDRLSPGETVIHVGKFSDGTLDGWKHRSFDGKTDYTFVTGSKSGPNRKILKASSDNSASGLFRKVHIDLEKTPWIHWSWRTEQLLSNTDENRKSGDDFTLRLYIIIDDGIFFWRSHALNYVWSSSHQTGETWANPFTSNSTMLAVESGDAKLGQWQHYKRNIRKDLRQLTEKDIRYIDAIAIMTDSDNSGQKATGYYRDIFFTSD
ncbi:MAG: DUF3047 domain-containing protein [Mariprofundaceae bacterium]